MRRLAVLVVEGLEVVGPGFLICPHALRLEALPLCEGHLDLVGRQGRTLTLRPSVRCGSAPQAPVDSDDSLLAHAHRDSRKLIVRVAICFAKVSCWPVESVAEAQGAWVGVPRGRSKTGRPGLSRGASPCASRQPGPPDPSGMGSGKIAPWGRWLSLPSRGPNRPSSSERSGQRGGRRNPQSWRGVSRTATASGPTWTAAWRPSAAAPHPAHAPRTTAWVLVKNLEGAAFVAR